MRIQIKTSKIKITAMFEPIRSLSNCRFKLAEAQSITTRKAPLVYASTVRYAMNRCRLTCRYRPMTPPLVTETGLQYALDFDAVPKLFTNKVLFNIMIIKIEVK